MKVLLAHTPEMRRNYYGERSLNGLRAIAEVILHEGDQPLDSASLVNAAKEADIIVADRMTEGRGEIFPQLPRLRAFVRCAVDIRNVDVEAASQAGVLVTRAGPGFDHFDIQVADPLVPRGEGVGLGGKAAPSARGHLQHLNPRMFARVAAPEG